MTMDELNAVYNNMSVYGDTYTAPSFDGEFKKKILPVDTSIPGLPIVQKLGTPYNDNDNDYKIAAANNNIDYNNLKVRDQSTGTGIDSDVAAKFKQYENYKFTDQDYINQINAMRRTNPNFNSYTDQDLKQMIDMNAFSKRSNFAVPQKTGILQSIKDGGSKLLDFIKKGGVIGNIASGLLPEMDPRQKALRDFYGDNFDLTSSGSVASGIMKNYNPVSGGGLYTLTGGRLGEEPTYGLGEAIDERMDNIKDMLGSKYKYNYRNDSQMYKDMIAGKIGKYGVKGHTSAAENYFKLKSLKEKEALVLKEARKKQQEKIKKQQEIQRQEFLKSDTRNNPVTGTVAIQQRIDRGDYDRSTPDRTTSSVTKSSAAKSKGVGGGGYTKSDTTRESYRGRYGKGGIVSL